MQESEMYSPLGHCFVCFSLTQENRYTVHMQVEIIKLVTDQISVTHSFDRDFFP